MAANQGGIEFEDFLLAMFERLATNGFMKELSKGFNLLTDVHKGVITFKSLKRSAALLGLQEMTDEEIVCMLREATLDGEGTLNEMEFCTLMFRLSPDLMQTSKRLLVEGFADDV